ncbi:MAG TPA: substrate-binding domain-containing protein [Acidimicrobiales bacterium]|nr:substrate-binding domain-containing protein [Acidimicrobiales bacterium]
MNISRKVRTVGAATVTLAATLAAFGVQVAPSASAAPMGITATSFNRNFTTMALLKPIVAKGSGGITAILPDTVSSTRYVEFDAPFLNEAMQKAGLPPTDIYVENADGSDATELAMDEAAVTAGDKVVIMDPLDSGVGAKIESYNAAHGVATIDYDRLTLGGQRKYYDSFNNVVVGTLLGNGLVSCITSWGVSKPVVLVMHGADTDNNATLFADGYDAVLQPYFSSGKYTLVGKLQPNEVPAGTWTPSQALSEFQGIYTSHSDINAVLTPNDENAAPIIHYLVTSKGLKPHTLPFTGQDATLQGLANVLLGYQCGTVYKPIYLEAQAAVALAVYARAHMTPPAALLNGKTLDSVEHKEVSSVLLSPEWVTAKNMGSTVIADNFVPASTLCASPYATASACKAAGINP